MSEELRTIIYALVEAQGGERHCPTCEGGNCSWCRCNECIDCKIETKIDNALGRVANALIKGENK